MGKDLIDIDGSLKSGSGTIVRYSLSLASLLKREIRIRNIRAKRKKPGLRPQHLKAVCACCQLTNGQAENASLKASQITFRPGKKIRGGSFRWDIGTAGSTTMMSLCLLPLGLFADKESSYTISGGLFQDFAPNAFHLKYVLMNLLRRFSLQTDLEIIKPGYVPTGGGIIEVKIKPVAEKLRPLHLPEQGKVMAIKGMALSSHLKKRKVSERMRQACMQVLAKAGYQAEIEVIDDQSANQPGAALFIYALTDKGCIIGSDLAGKLGRSAEEIGKQVGCRLLEDINSKATVDRFAADQLILYAALAEGESNWIIPRMTEHIDSNLWLVQKILGAKIRLEGLSRPDKGQGRNLFIEGIGLSRPGEEGIEKGGERRD